MFGLFNSRLPHYVVLEGAKRQDNDLALCYGPDEIMFHEQVLHGPVEDSEERFLRIGQVLSNQYAPVEDVDEGSLSRHPEQGDLLKARQLRLVEEPFDLS